MCSHVKHSLAVVAVRAYGAPMSTFLSGASSLSRARTALARQFIGRDAVQRETNVAVQRLRTMGYAMKSRTSFIESCVACLLAAAEKQRLIDITEEDFNGFISQPMSSLMRKAAVSLSVALYDMALVTRRYTRTRAYNRGPTRRASDRCGVASLENALACNVAPVGADEGWHDERYHDRRPMVKTVSPRCPDSAAMVL